MNGFWRSRGCRSHRTALLEFASQRVGGPAVRRALDHVERCRACEDELATTSLVLVGLRRLHDEVRGAEPATDGWTRLRARLTATRREPSRLLSGLPGIVAAAGLCAALFGPTVIAGGESSRVYDEAPPGVTRPSLEVEHRRTRADAASVQPVPLPTPIRSYVGLVPVPPAIEADLPVPTGRGVAWVKQVVETPAPPTATVAVVDTPRRLAGLR